MKDKYLFKNVNIISDDRKIILNGSIAFDSHIINIYHNLNEKILKEYEGKVFDLKGLNIMPSFVNIIDNYNLNSLLNDGVCAYVSNDIKCCDDDYCHFLGYHLKDNHDKAIMIDDLSDNNHTIKVLNNSNLSYDELYDKNIDVIYDLFHQGTGFDYKNPGIINLALTNKYYVIIDIDDVHDVVLEYILRAINKNKMIIISKNMSKASKRLYDLGINFNDIVAYTSLNLYHLLKIRNYGGLIKGKPSDFIVFDDNMKIIFKVIGGKLVKCHS